MSEIPSLGDAHKEIQARLNAMSAEDRAMSEELVRYFKLALGFWNMEGMGKDQEYVNSDVMILAFAIFQDWALQDLLGPTEN